MSPSNPNPKRPDRAAPAGEGPRDPRARFAAEAAGFEFLREVVDRVKAIICKVSPDGRILWMNRYGLEFFGFSEEEVVGRPAFETVTPLKESSGRDLSDLFARIVESGGTLEPGINENVRKDGSRVWVYWSNSVLRGAGALCCEEAGSGGGREEAVILSTGIDVTEKVILEREAKRLRERVDSLVRILSLLMCPQCDLAKVSAAVLEEAKRITGSTYGFVGTVDPETRELVGHTLEGSECGVRGRHEVRFPPGKDGRYRGLFGHALNTQQPFFSNSPRDHPASAGIPEGHIPIERFLAFPVVLEAEVLGIIALANPEGGREYTADDLDGVSFLSQYFALALQSKLLKDRIAKSEAHYRELFERCPIPVILVRRNDLIFEVNEAFEKCFGYSRGEVEGKLTWHVLAHPNELPRMKEYRRARLAGNGGIPVKYEVVLIRKDGSPVECQVNIILKKEGDVLAAIADLSDLKRMERELIEFKEELERYSKRLEELVEEKTRELIEKERLAAIGETALMVGHDLRSPLQAMTNLIFMTREVAPGLPPEKSAEVLEIAQRLERNVKYMDKIVSDLQDYGKAFVVERVPTDLGAVIESALFGVEVPEGVSVKVEVGAAAGAGLEVPPVEGHCAGSPQAEAGLRSRSDARFDVMLPPQLLARALKNLVTNAIQAMPEGGTVTVSAWLESCTPGGAPGAPPEAKAEAGLKAPLRVPHPQPHPESPSQRHGPTPPSYPHPAGAQAEGVAAVFAVSDTGPGIPPQIRENLFKPFRTTKSKGTGLGLAIVKRIVDAVGGTIEVHSEPGRGTRFVIRVPAPRAASADRAQAATTLNPRTPADLTISGSGHHPEHTLPPPKPNTLGSGRAPLP